MDETELDEKWLQYMIEMQDENEDDDEDEDEDECQNYPVSREGLYHIGLLVRNLVYTHDISIALYFDNVDQHFKYCYCNHSTGDYKDRYNLVLIKELSNTKAEDIIPLRARSILRSETELLDSGVQIVCKCKDEALLYDGKTRVWLDKEDSTLLLIHALKSLANNDEEILSGSKSLLRKKDLLSKIKEIEKEVGQYNIEEILNGLRIHVREHFSYRVGKDDYYYVYKTVTTDFPEDRLDNYLKDYIGIGTRCIYEDHAYTNAYDLRIKDLITGDYNEDQLAEEKKKLLDAYSINNHIYNNICEYVSDHMNPKGLSYAKLGLSLERYSLLPLLWRISRWKKTDKLLDELDRRCSPKGFSEESLNLINYELALFSEQTKAFRLMECYDGDPSFSVL